MIQGRPRRAARFWISLERIWPATASMTQPRPIAISGRILSSWVRLRKIAPAPIARPPREDRALADDWRWLAPTLPESGQPSPDLCLGLLLRAPDQEPAVEKGMETGSLFRWYLVPGRAFINGHESSVTDRGGPRPVNPGSEPSAPEPARDGLDRSVIVTGWGVEEKEGRRGVPWRSIFS